MVLSKISTKNITDVFRYPRLFNHAVKQPLWPIEKRIINKKYKKRKNPEPATIKQKDWDNLIILDACRYDYIQKECVLEGELTTIVSGGSESWGFMKHNFKNRTFHDTVYITANPHAERLDSDIFYAMISLLNEWDEGIDVTDAAIRANEKYNDKRLIIHFMQPHLPWTGPTANEINRRLDLKGLNNRHGKAQENPNITDPRTGNIDAFGAARRGLIDQKQIQNAYTETLNIVLEYVNKLDNSLEGKSVITSDHGEMLGEQLVLSELYGHYHNLWTKQLRWVPWLETKTECRRDVTKEDPINTTSIDSDVVNQRLSDLGYKK